MTSYFWREFDARRANLAPRPSPFVKFSRGQYALVFWRCFVLKLCAALRSIALNLESTIETMMVTHPHLRDPSKIASLACDAIFQFFMVRTTYYVDSHTLSEDVGMLDADVPLIRAV